MPKVFVDTDVILDLFIRRDPHHREALRFFSHMKKNKIQSYTAPIRILLIRGEKVIIDADLAEFYGVNTKVLNQAVRRNINRFPADFMFQLTKEEKIEVVTNCDHLQNLKYSSVNPYVFTEHGALMVASILNSVRAVEVSVFIVRAFVQLRRSVKGHDELSHLTKYHYQIGQAE